jgi:hypothetical protein
MPFIIPQVTFIANHDTDSTQQHWPFPPEGLEAGYAYILTHPGGLWDQDRAGV